MKKFLIKSYYQLFHPQTPKEYDLILSAVSEYYQNLNQQNREKFCRRLFILLKFIQFIPKDLPSITMEMKIVIGSAMIQITFGLKHYLLKHFQTIYIVPRCYHFTGFEHPFLGHVDFKHKVVCFSWEDVKTGFQIPDDTVNVALHEMAHALEMENKFRLISREFFDRTKWVNWEREAVQKLKIIQQGEHSFLKSYGGKNMHEMFAVCIETFFEKPYEFKKRLPKLYETMVNLLQQDPTKIGNPII